MVLVAAWVTPAERIDLWKSSHLAALAADSNADAERLTPADDEYVERVTQPYPISSGLLLRFFLIGDAIFLVAWGAMAPFVVGRRDVAMRPWWPRGETAVVVALTAAGAALRVIGSNRDLWIDEITTLVRHVRVPMGEILLQATSSNNHLLNSLLGRVSVLLFGESPMALRLPAVVFGSATIPAFYALARRFASFRETLLATLALVLSYHHVFFSQDARGYSGFLFGGLLGTIALLEALETDSAMAWIVYLIAMVISVTSVMIGFVLLVSQLLSVTVFRPTRRFYAVAALCAYAIAHVYAMVVPDILGFVLDDYKRPEVGWKLSAELVQVVLRGFALGPAAAAVLALGAGIAIVGIIGYWRQDRLLTALMLLPEALMLMALIGLGLSVFPRFFLFALPVSFLLAARGGMTMLACLPGRAAQRLGYAAATGVLVSVSAFMLTTWWRYPKQDYTGARRFVEAERAEGDAVVAVGIAGEAYRYYWPEIHVTNRISDLEAIAEHHRRVWVLYAFPRDMELRRPRLFRRIRDTFHEEREFRGMVGDGEIHVVLRVGS
jgi:hypothetical protein